MRSVLFLAIACLTLAMGGKRPPEDPQDPGPGNGSSDPRVVEAQAIKENFVGLGKVYGARFVTEKVSLSFGALAGSTIGVCYFNSSNNNNRIVYKASSWQNGSATFKEMLSFHELGHCLLGRGHRNTTHSSGRPESLMRSSLFSERTYRDNRDQYLKELFTGASQVSFSEDQDHIFDGCSFGR